MHLMFLRFPEEAVAYDETAQDAYPFLRTRTFTTMGCVCTGRHPPSCTYRLEFMGIFGSVAAYDEATGDVGAPIDGTTHGARHPEESAHEPNVAIDDTLDDV